MARAERPPAGASRRRQVLRAAVSVAVVVAVFAGVLPQVADLSEVAATVGAMTGLEVATAAAVAGWNLVSYWLVQLSVLPGLHLGQAAVASQSSTALANSVPGGAAAGIGLTYAIYSSWGFPRAAVTLSLLLSGIWNTFVKVGMPLFALALLAVQGDATTALVVAALAGVAMIVVAVAVFGLLLRSDALARRIGTSLAAAVSWLRRLVRRPPVADWGDAAVRFRAQTIDLLAARWLALTASTLVSHLSLYLVLLVVLRHVGVVADEVTWAEALGAFAFVRLLSALPITPGGLGVVELGLTGALVVAGGDRAAVVAAVLVYRALTYLLPIPLGGLTYLVWRRRTSWRRPGEVAQARP
ncbi:MAG: YbhN family protein [Actinomycetota bacterium]|nr:YbhN family protein [Actinomycetota bacterium]